jgi:undecaprenyl phosphate N,N'-diacetylbacillosamine 1-phosphate transferase
MVSAGPSEALKRGLDTALAGLVLLLAIPLMLVASLLIYLEDRGPVFYKQKRIGQHLREYDMLKFRSMRVNDVPVELLGQVSGNHPLVTRVGRVIRRFRIDELPQLLNVLSGDMSIVGPRPAIPEQVQRYNSFERRRLLMPSGMTGWAQVNGNTHLSWPERIALDVWYVDHWSLWLDIVILIRTVSVVVLGERPNRWALQEALKHEDCPRRCN